MGKKVTFSEGAEMLGVPISTISKWFSQGLFKHVELDRKSPGGPTYLLRVEELLAIKDAIEAESMGEELARKEIAATKGNACENKIEFTKKRLSLVKTTEKKESSAEPLTNEIGKEIVLRIQEETAAGIINSLTSYASNFEQKFLQHMEEQADKNAYKFNTMAIEHLETLKNMSLKMEKVVDVLITMPQKVSDDTVKAVSEIKEMIPDLAKVSEINKDTREKLDSVGKKLEKLSEEIKDTKWAVVKMARENNKVGKKENNKKKMSKGFVSGIGKIFGLSK
ncbi:hypothetical protein Dred_2936 [Desulforamulus reducens MI-1]|uniref:Uncharacterized protein n=1 Tax=Desulforamulus reducens (strain ATCC BAA-1160 / DSM 100696 / MI-1) TaxID=349161 RepID=A4J8N6_DESRM|nr:hypothetical protein [Desulforamulus reducens]ABO51439.1 hypothetical protein Dred_2936 [Desulforamulus reducens MI-1]